MSESAVRDKTDYGLVVANLAKIVSIGVFLMWSRGAMPFENAAMSMLLLLGARR